MPTDPNQAAIEPLRGEDFDRLVTRARNGSEWRLKSWVTRGVKALSHFAGLNPAVQRLSTEEAAILMYHKVQRRPVGLWGEPVINVDAFDQHLSYLARNFEVVPMSTLVNGLKGLTRLPSRAVAITFDDGYRNNLVLAAPVLKRHRLPATFFITTGVIGTNEWSWPYELEEMFLRYPLEQLGPAANDPIISHLCSLELPKQVAVAACVEYLKQLPHPRTLQVVQALRQVAPVDVDDENRFMSWDDVRALAADGFEIGSHTVSHPILTRTALEDAERELAQSREDLEREVRVRPWLFAYPNGDYGPALSKLVKRYYGAAVSTVPEACSRRSDLFALPRLCAPVEVSDLSFDLARQLVVATRAHLASPASFFEG